MNNEKSLIIGVFILGLYLLYLYLSKVNICMKTQKHVNCSIVERKYVSLALFPQFLSLLLC